MANESYLVWKTGDMLLRLDWMTKLNAEQLNPFKHQFNKSPIGDRSIDRSSSDGGNFLLFETAGFTFIKIIRSASRYAVQKDKWR